MDSLYLGRISRSSHGLIDYINTRRGRLPLLKPTICLSLTLPEPIPIADKLLHIGWKHEDARLLSAVYMRSAMQSKTDWERNMNEAISKCLQTEPSMDVRSEVATLHDTYLAMYERDLESRTKCVIERIHGALASSTARHQPPARNAAKLGVASILEAIFQDNAYPTRLEKVAVADRIGLEYKQVDVWFQNRRNRSKREGKEMKKSIFIVESGDLLQSTRPECTTTVSTSSQSVTIEDHSPPITQRQRPLDIESAPHAFPNTFPPVCDYEPFPILDGLQTFDTSWPRHTSSIRHEDKNGDVILDIDQLCMPLSKLSLTDVRSSGASCQNSVKRTGRLRDRVMACFPILLHPPTAPLPALVHATVTVHAATTKHGTSSLSTHIVHVSRLSAASSKKPSKKRPVDALCRRVPQPLPKVARGLTHPYRPGKPSREKPRLTRVSRLSSLSSLSSFSSDDSCSSRASSASLESPPPLTPPQLPTALPQSTKNSTADVIFSPSQDLDRLFYNSEHSRHILLSQPQD